MCQSYVYTRYLSVSVKPFGMVEATFYHHVYTNLKGPARCIILYSLCLGRTFNFTFIILNTFFLSIFFITYLNSEHILTL